MKGRSGRALERKLQSGKAVERREFVIRQDQVDIILFKGRDELGTSLDPGDLTVEMLRFKDLLNEFSITRGILQQQNAARRSHSTFFMLPGGGWLMMPQKTPSSFIALMNSWKSTGFTTYAFTPSL